MQLVVGPFIENKQHCHNPTLTRLWVSSLYAWHCTIICVTRNTLWQIGQLRFRSSLTGVLLPRQRIWGASRRKTCHRDWERADEGPVKRLLSSTEYPAESRSSTLVMVRICVIVHVQQPSLRSTKLDWSGTAILLSKARTEETDVAGDT